MGENYFGCLYRARNDLLVPNVSGMVLESGSLASSHQLSSDAEVAPGRNLARNERSSDL